MQESFEMPICNSPYSPQQYETDGESLNAWFIEKRQRWEHEANDGCDEGRDMQTLIQTFTAAREPREACFLENNWALTPSLSV
jgi:hypothetical protein